MISEINNLDRSLPFKTFAERAAEIREKKAKREETVRFNRTVEMVRTGTKDAPGASSNQIDAFKPSFRKPKKRVKKIKRKSLAKLKKELYAEIKKYMMAIPWFTGFCPTCGPLRGAPQTEKADTLCHKLPKGDYPAIQFDIDNLYIGCNRCNIAEYSRRALWATKFREWMPAGKYESLEKRGREICKWDRSWLEEKIRHYRSLSQEGIGG